MAVYRHHQAVPTAEENSPPYTEADYYGHFMTVLFGLIDDAELSGYSAEATERLSEATDLFWREFRERYPDAWSDKPSSKA